MDLRIEFAFRFARDLIARRTVSSASAAAESLFFESPKKSNQKKGDPGVALAMKPRVRVGWEGFLTERSEGVGEAPTAHPCAGKNARASMRAPRSGPDLPTAAATKGTRGQEQQQRQEQGRNTLVNPTP